MECVKAKRGDQIEIEGYPRKIKIDVSGHGIFIHVEGYGDFNSRAGDGYPVFVDLFGVDGYDMPGDQRGSEYEDPRILIYADINNEDPTHKISLKYAREELRKADA